MGVQTKVKAGTGWSHLAIELKINVSVPPGKLMVLIFLEVTFPKGSTTEKIIFKGEETADIEILLNTNSILSPSFTPNDLDNIAQLSSTVLLGIVLPILTPFTFTKNFQSEASQLIPQHFPEPSGTPLTLTV